MILLLGASGYIGQAFADELRRRGVPFIPLSRRAIDYTHFEVLFDYIRKVNPSFLINAAGYTGHPDIDSCESERGKTLMANVVFPQVVAKACYMTNTPWGHVSSACIYSGARRFEDGGWRNETDLNNEETRQLLCEEPERFRPFTELDEPNFSFRHTPCSFYSGTKVLAEETLRGFGNNYIWRPGIVFDQIDESRNLLSKLQRCAKIHDCVNPLSHRGDFVRSCLDLWERSSPFGIYNVVNPGAISTRHIAEMMERMLPLDRRFEFWRDDAEFYDCVARAPRPGCLLSAAKLLAAGVRMRPAQEALEHTLARWSSPAQVETQMVPVESWG